MATEKSGTRGDGAGNSTSTSPSDADAPRPRWRSIGPGIVAAATGVGAGDLVSTLLAGSKFGYALLWAAIVGCLIKVALAEAVGRWHLASGRTIFDGWRLMGRWTTVYFAIYIVIWGFVYGATAMTSSALPLQALFPGGPGLKFWAILTGLAGLGFVWFNRYAVVEKIMMVLVGLMFVVVVYVAIRVAPSLGDAVTGLIPTLPDQSILYTLGLVGGVGGTITMAAYGYWVNAKGWTNSGWMKMMRLDNRVAYGTTAIFVVAMLIIGAELLHASSIALGDGGEGLVGLGDVLEKRFGGSTATLFLIGFFAASFSSLVGVWHGVSLLFADFVERVRAARAAGGDPAGEGVGADTAESGVTRVAHGERERSLPFRGYVLWLTIPPMSLLWLGKPFGLVVAYGVLGSLFLPFLAATLLWLLNSKHTPRQWRSRIVSNTVLSVAGVLFVILLVEKVRSLLG